MLVVAAESGRMVNVARAGTKFVLTAEPGTPDLDNVLHGIYELYSDFVLKVGGRRMGKKAVVQAWQQEAGRN